MLDNMHQFFLWGRLLLEIMCCIRIALECRFRPYLTSSWAPCCAGSVQNRWSPSWKLTGGAHACRGQQRSCSSSAPPNLLWFPLLCGAQDAQHTLNSSVSSALIIQRKLQWADLQMYFWKSTAELSFTFKLQKSKSRRKNIGNPKNLWCCTGSHTPSVTLCVLVSQQLMERGCATGSFSTRSCWAVWGNLSFLRDALHAQGFKDRPVALGDNKL